MINLYLIDYYDRKNSGLATYVTQLSNHFGKDHQVRLHFILVKVAGRQLLEKEEIDGRIVYNIPFNFALRIK